MGNQSAKNKNEDKYFEYQDYINEVIKVNNLRKSDIFNTSLDSETELWFDPKMYGEGNLELDSLKIHFFSLQSFLLLMQKHEAKLNNFSNPKKDYF